MDGSSVLRKILMNCMSLWSCSLPAQLLYPQGSVRCQYHPLPPSPAVAGPRQIFFLPDYLLVVRVADFGAARSTSLTGGNNARSFPGLQPDAVQKPHCRSAILTWLKIMVRQASSSFVPGSSRPRMSVRTPRSGVHGFQRQDFGSRQHAHAMAGRLVGGPEVLTIPVRLDH